MNQSEHERCSALLLAYVHDDLSSDDARWVSEHLQSCVECSAERSGLAALLGGPDEVLTDLERVRLHHGVAAGTGATSTATTVLPTRSERWGRKLVPYLGAAATIALLLFAVSQVDLMGADDGSPASSADEEAESVGGDNLADGDDSPSTASSDTESQQERSGGDKTVATNGSAIAAAPGSLDSGSGETGSSSTGPRPLFESIGKVSPRELERRAVHDPPFTSFAQSYSGSSALKLQDRFVTLLARDAKDRKIADTVRTCADLVLSEGTDVYSLPAYGALATIDGTRALLLGFAYTVQEKAPLNRFQLWAWQRPGCENIVMYRRGPIRP